MRYNGTVLDSNSIEFPHPKMNAIESLSSVKVAALCKESRPGKLHEMYCFELFRRAIIDRQQECWSILFEQYQKLVYRWIQEADQNHLVIGDTTYEEIALDTFTTFWRSYSPEKLTQADSLGSVLRYLKSCAGTSLLQASRKANAKKRFANLQPEELGDVATTQSEPIEDFSKREEAETLWQVVKGCCYDEKDQIIAWHSLVLAKRPSQILDEFGTHFVDIDEIGNRRRNLKSRLSRNDLLQELWGRK